MMRRALLVLAAAAGLMLAACGGDDGAGSDGKGRNGIPSCESLIGQDDWAKTVRSDTSCIVDDAMQMSATFDCDDGSELIQVGDWGYGNSRGELHKGNANKEAKADYQGLYAECFVD